MTSSSETITERANEKYKKFVRDFFFLQKRKMKEMKNEKDEERNENGNRRRSKCVI